MGKEKIDYRKYCRKVKKDFNELKLEYPYSIISIPPTVKPSEIRLSVVAVNISFLKVSLGIEEDFLGEYSKKINIVVPFNYQKIGCHVYGGKWLRDTLIHKDDRHFYGKQPDGTRLFCVGVPASFGTLKNVILENVKTAENMLIAYEQVQRGVTKRTNLIDYKHGKEGEMEYEADKEKYKSKK